MGGFWDWREKNDYVNHFSGGEYVIGDFDFTAR